MQFTHIPHFQILIFVESCNRINRQSLHTLENPKHSVNSRLQVLGETHICFLFLFWVFFWEGIWDGIQVGMPHQEIAGNNTALNTVLHRNLSNSFPESPGASSLANTLIRLFKYKIDRIHPKCLPSHSPDLFLFRFVPISKLTNFILATLTEICKLISAFESKQCLFDSISTSLLKLSVLELDPIITDLIASLSLSLKKFFHSHSNNFFDQPLLKNISIHWCSQQLSFNFEPQFHFQHSRESCCLSHSISPVFYLCDFFSICLPGHSTETILFQNSQWSHDCDGLWIVMRSFHSYFSTYLLPLILSIIPSFSPDFKIVSVLMFLRARARTMGGADACQGGCSGAPCPSAATAVLV